MSDKIYDWEALGLQSLDLILCKGNSKLSKYIYHTQKFAGANKEDARFTHVGGIIADHRVLQTDVYESTTLNKYSGKKGVQRNLMSRWLPNYNGEVYVRKLKFSRTSDFLTTDQFFRIEHCRDKYESGIPGGVELLLCALRIHKFIPWYTPMETKELHCTELIAKRLEAHDLWETNSDIVANRMPPYFWASEIDNLLRCDISDLIRIK